MWNCGFKLNRSGLLVSACTQSHVGTQHHERCLHECTLEMALRNYFVPLLKHYYESKESKVFKTRLSWLEKMGLLFQPNITEKVQRLSKQAKVSLPLLLHYQVLFWEDLLRIIGIPANPTQESLGEFLSGMNQEQLRNYLLQLSVYRMAQDLQKIYNEHMGILE